MKFPDDSEFLCIHGWDEVLYREALSWIDDRRRVAFISEQEQVSEDPRIQIHCLDSPLQIEGLMKKIAWSAVQRKLAIVAGHDFQEKLQIYHLAANLVLSEAADWGVKTLKNARANQKPYRWGLDLKGAFHGIPAVIVGAGPSLQKNGHLLQKFTKKALIFAGGSALNAIDVEPHFAASIDADAPYRQFKAQPFAETPFCYQSRMNAENFSLLHGERLLFPDSSSDAINWIYGEERFDSGWTVGNFLTAVALHLGCSPLIFVGMDYCYLHNRKYAQIDADLPEGLVRFREVWTQNDWLMAARWTEEQAKGRSFINATEGGILSLPTATLETVLSKYSTEWDLHEQVHEAVQKLPLRKPPNRWKQWDASLRRLKKGVEQFEEECVYQKLLSPLWQIWKPIFEREVELDTKQNIELHRTVFFQRVLEEHA